MTDGRDFADSSWTNSTSGTLEIHPNPQLPHDPCLFPSLFNHETDSALDGQTTTHAVSKYKEDSLTSGGTIDPKLLLLSPPSPSTDGDDDSCESGYLSPASPQGACFQPTPSISSRPSRSGRRSTTVPCQSAISTRTRRLSEQGATRSTQSVSENSRQERKWPHPKLEVLKDQSLVINGEPVKKMLDEAHVLLQQRGMEELSAGFRQRVERLLEQVKPDRHRLLNSDAHLGRKYSDKRRNFRRRLLTFVRTKYALEGKLRAKGVEWQIDKLENDWQELQNERIRLSSAGAI